MTVTKQKPKRPHVGRPVGPYMPCGWGCGKQICSSEMMQHFKKCPKRPKA